MEINFKKIHTGKDLVITLIVIAAGIGLYFVSPVAGVCVALCGVVMFFCCKSGYKMDNQDTIYKKVSLDLSQKSKTSVVQFLTGNSDHVEMQKGNEGGTIILTVYCNDTQKIAYAQASNFSSFGCQPLTEMVEVRSPRYERLIEAMK